MTFPTLSDYNPYSHNGFIWDWTPPTDLSINKLSDSEYENEKDYSFESSEENSIFKPDNNSFSEDEDTFFNSDPRIDDSLKNTAVSNAGNSSNQKSISIDDDSSCDEVLSSQTLSNPSTQDNFDSSDSSDSSWDIFDIPFEPKKLKQGRVVKPASLNLAPSVQNSPDLDTDELIIDHAGLRIQLMYLRLLAVYKLGIRSDNTLSDVEVSIEHANYQYGKGSQTKGTHAAHACAIAGCTDNIRELCIEQNIEDGKLTPKKIRLLAAKHFPSKAIEKLKDSETTTDEVKEIYARFWPKTHLHESVLSGTKLERTLNATDELYREVNILCDKYVEKEVRPYAAALVKEVILGTCSPEKGTKKYHEKIQQHFTTAIGNLQERVLLVEKHLNNLKKLKRLKLSDNNIHGHFLKLIEKMSDRQKHMKVSKIGISKTCLEENQEFIKSSLKKLQKSDSTSLSTFHKWFLGKYIFLKEECRSKVDLIKDLLKYNSLQKEGTILPPFEFFTYKYNPLTQQHSPETPKSASKRQYKMLSTEISNIKKHLSFGK